MSSLSSSSLYQTCAVKYSGSTDAVLQCIANEMESRRQASAGQLLDWLLVLAGALVFFMQTGFAMLCAGCVRKKNLQNTMLKNLLDACAAAIAFYATGFALAFGDDDSQPAKTFVGSKHFVGMGEFSFSFWFFQYAFSATSVTIVAGTLAERCKMAAYLMYGLVLTGFVYPVVVHAIWSSRGFLSVGASDPLGGIGVIDFAGSGVVHVTGGCTALIAAKILGARRGRFHDKEGNLLDKPKEFPGHSLALQLLGTMILWFGWYGFNPGSTLLLGDIETGKVAALAAINTTLSAAVGAVVALLTDLFLHERKTGERRFNLTVTMNGLLTALVSITAGCGTVDYFAAIIIGAVAGWIYLAGSALLLRLHIDDAVDAIPVHMFGGAWGLVSTGLFTTPERLLDAFGSDQFAGLFYAGKLEEDHITLFANQCIALLFIVAWVTATMWPFFKMLNWLGLLRAEILDELIGLDAVLHGGHFQEEALNGDINDAGAPASTDFKVQADRGAQNGSAEQSDLPMSQNYEESFGDDYSNASPIKTRRTS